MANSYVEYTTTGSGTNGLSQTIFTAPTKFLSINDIRIKGHNGSTWTELTISTRGTTTVTLSAAPTAYSKIRVFRSSTTESLIDFQNGSRLSESDLDTAYQQSLFVAQEVAEDADPEGGSGIGNVVNSQLAGGITNDKLAGGITQDKLAGGITSAQLAGSIADSKLASGVGTSANNLVKLDGTAKLPAVDGSQLTNLAGISKFTSAETTISSSTKTTFPHSLGAIPFQFDLYIKCTTAEAGYVIGDIIKPTQAYHSTAGTSGIGAILSADATNIYLTTGGNSAGGIFKGFNQDTGSEVTFTNSNFKIIVKAFL